MFKQMRQWQNALTLTLILMCVGIGLSHHIEATLSFDHSEHCGICMYGSSSPVMSGEPLPLDVLVEGTVFETSSITFAYNSYAWPDYATRAPPWFNILTSKT